MQNDNEATMTKETKRIVDIANCFPDGIDDLVFFAFRYFFGRSSIHTCCFINSLITSWPLLDNRIQALIMREIEEAFEKTDKLPVKDGLTIFGFNYMKEEWDKLRKCYSNKSTKG